MPQIVRVPGLGDIQFPDNMSKEEIKSALDTQVPELQKQRANVRPDYTTGEMLSKAVQRGGKQISSALGDVIPAMVAKGLGFEDYAKQQMEEAAQTQAEIASQYAPQYSSYKDVENPLQALGYIGESVAEQIPNLATALIPGGIGAQVGRRVGVGAAEKALLSEATPFGAEQLTRQEALNAARNLAGQEAAKVAEAQMARRGAGLGMNLGIYMGSFTQNVPEVFQNIYDSTGKLEPGAAVLAGSISSAFDSAFPAYLVNKFSGPRKAALVEKLLEKSGMQPSLARTALATLPEAAALEGLTEGAQEAISIEAEKFISKNESKFNSEDWNRILESTIKGSAAGLGFGVPGSIVSRAREKYGQDEGYPTDTTGLGDNLPVPGQPLGAGLPGAVEEGDQLGATELADVVGRLNRREELQPGALKVTEPTTTEVLTEEPAKKTRKAKAVEAPVTPVTNLTPEAEEILAAYEADALTPDMSVAIPRVLKENGIPPTRDKKTKQYDDKLMLQALADKRDAYRAAQVQENRVSGNDVGYHAGDLGYGRDTTLGNMSSGRSTGHFGTGVYFTGTQEALGPRTEERPVKQVDFSQYNLARPETREDAFDLHDGLKAVNNIVPDVQEGVTEKPGYWGATITTEGELNKATDLLAKALKIEDKAALRQIIDEEVKNAADKLEGVRFTPKYEPTAATNIMKRLGFDGVDVRGIPDLDNTAYGSVIYTDSLAEKAQEARTEALPTTQETKESITEHLKGEFGNNVVTAQKRGNLQIANDVSELPQEVQDKIEPNAVGAYHKGVSYLIANRMDKPTARRTLLHEVGEHHGLEGMLGKDLYKQVLRSLKANKDTNKDIAKAWGEVGTLYPELKESDEQYLREVLAKIGENAPQNTLWRRVVGAVKNFLTKLGLYNPNKFTTADLQDLITHSLRKTLKQPRVTPSRETQFAKMGPTNTVDPKMAAQLLQSASDIIRNAPAYNSDLGVQARAALSKVGPGMRKLAMSFLSLPNKIDLYGDRLPQLRTLLSALENRASEADQLRSEVDINTHKYMAIMKKYPSHIIKKFNQLTLKLSAENVTPVKTDVDYDANNDLVRNYEQLPKELQELGIEISNNYTKYSNDMVDILENLIGPGSGAAAALRKRFESNRLKFYHPLRRKGQYWTSYLDKSGELGVIASNSPAERDIAIRNLASQGATDFNKFTRLETADYKQAPPVGFVSDVIKQLDKQLGDANIAPDVAEGIKNQVYQTYLDLLPAESLRQQFRQREGIPGYIEDVVGGYADVGSKLANQLTNLKYRPQIDGAISDMKVAVEQLRRDGAEDIEALTDVTQDILNQKEFLDNPIADSISSRLSWVSYIWNIAGNVSSALVNLTQLFMVVYPMLAGKFGWGRATSMMMNAASNYFKGGLDTNREFLPDWTFGAKLKQGDKYFNLYKEAIRNSAMRRGVGYELTELRNRTAEEFTGTKAKVETALGWIFQNSERMNREVTLMAAYDLAKESGMTEEAAVGYALDITTRAHSHTLSEAGPKLFQTGFGKVAFTFKRFAQAQMYNVGRLAYLAFKGMDPAERKIARKQLMGIMGMTYAFSGLQGLPMYGAANVLSSAMAAMFGDDDEPYDFDEEVRNAVGMLGYKGPINLLTNIDIAGRTGFNGMVWRDDPRRLAEVGLAPYFVEHFFGPAYQAMLVNPVRAAELWNQGHVDRAIEQVLPTAAKNPLKAFRFATEGALTTNGAKIVDDVSAYSAFMQIFGFANAELTEAYTRASAMKEAEKKVQNRRTALLNLHYLAKSNGDVDMVQKVREDIQGFNESWPNYKISSDTLARSYRGHEQRIKDSVYGVNLNKKLKAQLMAAEEED